MYSMKLAFTRLLLIGCLLIPNLQQTIDNVSDGIITMQNRYNTRQLRSELPPGMIIPDASAASLPQLNSFNVFAYKLDTEIAYNDAQLEYLSAKPDEYRPLMLSSLDSSSELSYSLIFIHKDGYGELPHDGIATRIPGSNLYVDTLLSHDSDQHITGKIIFAYTEDKVQVSIGYFEERLNRLDKQNHLPSGFYSYSKIPTSTDLKEADLLGDIVTSDDYTNYNGNWYMYTYYPEDYEFTLNIIDNENISGRLRYYSHDHDGVDEDAVLYGKMINHRAYLLYDDDGYGHSGCVIVTFHENGLQLYIDEVGFADSGYDGLFLGTYSYFKIEDAKIVY